MVRGLYSAATGLNAALQQQDVTAQNLASATSPGYRQKGVAFETLDRQLGRTATPAGDITGTHVAGIYNDFRPGALQYTGNSLDLAVDGDSFFTLQGPRGLMYSRNGSFHLNAQNQIVSQGGYPLVGSNGPIQVPPGTAEINVASDGSVSADGSPFEQIQRARFTNMRQLVSVAPTLYSAPPTAGLQPSTDRVLQGYREASNVQPADAMIQMISGARHFEASQRALRTIAESIQLNTRPSV